MVDYEIDGYTVEFHRTGSVSDSAAHFDTEEDALDFIWDSRHRWDWFKLIQFRVANYIEEMEN
jgi:hypothetical protein